MALAVAASGAITHRVDAMPALTQPQRSISVADSLVRDARERASLGDTASALALLERATDAAPRDPDALYWRGLLLSRASSLSLGDTPRLVLAGHLLNRANDIDPHNARYLLELARIRLKTPLLRVDAERLFRKALTVAEESGDPAALADVAYELGLIKQRRYLTGRDRWMYTANDVIFDPVAARTRPHYTREFLRNLAQPIDNAAQVDRLEAEELFRRALGRVPTHTPSAVALMGLLYDQRRYDEMRRIAAPLVAADTASPRMLMATALATYRLGQLGTADTLFARALARFSIAERNELTNLGRITRKADSIRIEGLSNAERARTDSAFWESADPMLSTAVNEARLEFLARMAYADLRFSDDDTRQIGWRTDRGLVIARYGEPPVVATFAPSSDADAKDAIGRVITVWFYPRTETEFVFTGPPAMNVASFAGNHRGFAEEQREFAPFLLDNVPLATAVDTIPVQLARMRADRPGRSQVLIAATVPTDRLYRGADIDRGALELSFRTGQPAALRLAKLDTVSVSLPSTRRLGRVWVDTVRANAPYRVRVEARDAALQNAMGRAQSELEIPLADTTRLSGSDVVFADRLTVSSDVVGRWDKIGLMPRGDLTLAPLDTFAVYWETYGLRPDAAGRVTFEVRLIVTLEEMDRGTNGLRRLLGGISDLVGLSPVGDEQVGLRFERNEALGGRDRVPQLVTLGLGSAPPGRYRLDVVVTDHQSGSVSRSQRQFHIRRS